MKKKVLAVLLASAMVASLASGCGNKASETTGTTTTESAGTTETASAAAVSEEAAGESEGITFPLAETKNFSMLCIINGDTPMDEVDAFKHLNEQSNIIFDVNSIPQEDASEKEGLILSAGDYPDVFIFSSLKKNDIDKYGAEGVFVPLEDYIRTYAPNLTSLLDERELWPYITAPDGHVYEMPALNTGAELEAGFHIWLNYQWLDNLGLSMPTSIDEYYDVLVAFKEQDANGNGDPDDEIPLLFTSDSGGYTALEKTLLDAYGIFTTDPNYVLQADESGKVELANINDTYKEYLKFMHRLYAEGLMEQEAFTITGDEITTKQQGDVYGSFGCGSAPFVMANKDISYDANWMALSGMSSELHPKREASIASPVQNSILVAVNGNTEYPEALARFIDYFYTEEGMLSATKGYDGVTFDMVQDDLLGTEVPEMRIPDGYTSGEEFRYKGAILNEALNLVEKNIDRQAMFESDREVLEKPEFVEKYGWAARVIDAFKSDDVTGVEAYPVVSYTSDEVEERGAVYKDITTYLKQARAQFITGELDLDKDWDTYVNTLNQMNLGRLLEIEQAAYDRYAAVKG